MKDFPAGSPTAFNRRMMLLYAVYRLAEAHSISGTTVYDASRAKSLSNLAAVNVRDFVSQITTVQSPQDGSTTFSCVPSIIGVD